MDADARRAQADANNTALESLSDDGAPPELHELSLRCQAETGQRITALKRSTKRTWEPARPTAGPASEWQMRRVTGSLRPTDPEPVEVVRQGWSYVVAGNPVIVEGWLKRHGYPHASAGSPTMCFVAESRPFAPESRP
jgi:hypothetical protein